jgi:VWFA-related protein
MSPDAGTCSIIATILLSSLLVGSRSLSGNQDQTPTFRGGVVLVALDVSVIAKDGKSVTNLAPADFSIKLSGQDRKVQLLEYISFDATAPINRPAMSSAGATQDGTSGRTLARTIVVMVDDLGAHPGELKRLTQATERMVSSLPSSDLVGALTASGDAPAINPSVDRAGVQAFLRSVAMAGRRDDSVAGMFIGVNEAIEIDSDVSRDALTKVAERECLDSDMGAAPSSRGGSRVPVPNEECVRRLRAYSRMLANQTWRTSEMQVAAITRTIEALRFAARPRIMILLSTGLGLHERQDMASLLDRVSAAAANAEVQLFGVVEVNDGVEMKDRIFGRTRARQAQGRFLTSGLQSLALAAGGEAFPVIGMADRFLERIVAQTGGLYRIGVEAPTNVPAEALLNVEVKVNRRDVRVLTRRQVMRR